MPRNKPHYRITEGDAMRAHASALANFGGREGIHDANLIKSAVARPYTGYYRPMYKKAAVLLQSVALNHGFIDGNKRTAYTLFHLLLAKSGYDVRKSSLHEEDDIEHLILDICTKFLQLDEIMLWLKNRIHRV